MIQKEKLFFTKILFFIINRLIKNVFNDVYFVQIQIMNLKKLTKFVFSKKKSIKI